MPTNDWDIITRRWPPMLREAVLKRDQPQKTRSLWMRSGKEFSFVSVTVLDDEWVRLTPSSGDAVQCRVSDISRSASSRGPQGVLQPRRPIKPDPQPPHVELFQHRHG